MAGLTYETSQHAPQFAPSGPGLPAQIRAAAEAGFAGLLLDTATVDRYRGEGGGLPELARLIDRAGLAVTALTPLVIEDVDGVRSAVRDVEPIVAELHSPVVVTIFRADPNAERLAAAAWASSVLGEQGARLAVEFVPFGAITNLGRARAVAEQIDAGICLDAWHFLRGDADWTSLADIPVERLAYVQLTDALPPISDDARHETVHRRTFCGQGELDLARFTRVLGDKGYQGPVGLEVLNAEYRALDCAEFALRLMSTTLPFWA